VHDEHSARFALEHADGSSSLLEYTLRHALRRAPRVGEAAPDEDAADLVVMDIWHTETPDAHRGMGIAGALTATAFSHARERGWRVQASCSYVSKTFLPKHPELAHLVWADDPDATLTPDSA
jgi:predicted GNAT family acetyltransferase